MQKGHAIDIERATLDNGDFRRVLYTGAHCQLVLMCLSPGEEIGEEVHDVDQFFRIEAGKGMAVVNGYEYAVADGSSLIVPAGAKHNVVNIGREALKLYTIYAPPHHRDGTVHKTKADALGDDEEFDGATTE